VTGERRDEGCPHEELAVGWAMHALEPDEEALLRTHLPGCARCRQTVQSTEQVTAALGGSIRQEDPPPRLRARLMAAIEHTPQEPVAPAPAEAAQYEGVAAPIALDSRRRRVVTRTRVLLAAAAVVLIALIAGVLGVQYAKLSDQVAAQTTRTEQLQQALRVAADPATNRAVLRTGTGDPVAVLLNGDRDAAVMPVKLNPNDTTKQVYVVWGTSTTNPVPLATFDVQPGTGEMTLLSWSPNAHVHNGFAISLEPGRAAPATPSDVMAQGQVASA
jgi:hypothetical protein